MNKQDALSILFECAKLYKANLEDKNLLFLSVRNKIKFNYIEVKFRKSNYQHLTGVIVDESKITPSYFYKQCLNKRLSKKNIEFKSDGTTPLKLSVLKPLMNIYNNSKMIGDFNYTNPRLCCDKITGDTVACMGFKKDGDFYVPVTILKEDSRDLINNQERVVVIFSKNIKDKLYNEINYQVKDIENLNLKNIPMGVLEKLDYMNMKCNFTTNLTDMLIRYVVRETIEIAAPTEEDTTKEIEKL